MTTGATGRRRHPFLLGLTMLNAIAAVGAVCLRPGTSNWANPARIACHEVWEATGAASIALVAGWVILVAMSSKRVGSLKRAGPTGRVGLAIAIVHAVAWIMLPSWS